MRALEIGPSVALATWASLTSWTLAFGVVAGAGGCASRVQVRTPPAPVTVEAPTPPKPAAPPQNEGLNMRVGQSDVKAVYFGFDSSQLTPEAEADLKKVAERLRSDKEARVRFEGNCDERGTTEYNLSLGEQRADAARRYLVRLGIEGSRITTLSYGKERPAVEGHDEATWARNRRDDVVFRGNDG
jgi:peptidoglycan-associated lipoprotein